MLKSFCQTGNNKRVTKATQTLVTLLFGEIVYMMLLSATPLLAAAVIKPERKL